MARTRDRKLIATAVCLAATLVASTSHAAPAPAPAPAPGIPGGPPLTPGEDAEETYQLNFVGIQHREVGGHMAANGMYIPKTELWEGFRGKYKLRLGVIEFYDAVARPDLHAEATRHVIVTSTVLVAGAGLLVGGAIYTFRGWKDGAGPPKLPLAAAGAGLILLLIGKSLTWQPTTESEAYKLARMYNDRLRAHLGLPPLVEDPTQPEVAAASARRQRQRQLVLVPSLAPQGGGLLLLGTF